MRIHTIVTLLMVSLVMMPGIASPATRSITISTWGGLMTKAQDEAFFKPFTAKTGIQIKVTESSAEQTAKIKAQVMQNIPDIDLACGVGGVESLLISKDGYLLPIDYSKIPNAKDIFPEAKGEFIIGAYVLSTNVVYNRQFFPNGGPRTARDFFDVQKYPGPRGLKGYSAYGTLEAALIADGVPLNALYPLDIDRAYRKLNQIKPSVAVFYNTGAQQTQSLIDREVYAGYYYAGRAMAAKDAGQPIEVEFQDGYLNLDYWMIPRNTRDKEAVFAFLNFVLEPEREAASTKILRYAPINPKTIPLLPADLQRMMATHPDNLKKQRWLDDAYWADRYKTLNEQYVRWVSSK